MLQFLGESDPTRSTCAECSLKRAEGSLSTHTHGTAPQRERFDSPKKCAEGSLLMFRMPQRARSDPPNFRRGFAFDAQSWRRATARAIRPAQGAQRVHFRCRSILAPRHSSDSPKVRRGFTFDDRAALQRERSSPPKAHRRFTN